MTDSTAQIDDALEALRTAIVRVVRDEQLRDRLTGLGNDQALSEWIKEVIHEKRPFWIAFVEVDRFKETNDRFGYTNADILLEKIAEQLKLAATYFPHGLAAFRAHGDEFYLAGPLAADDPKDVAEALDHVRASIGRMKVRTAKPDDTMQCTVSVGWTSEAEARGGEREVRHTLELATAAAKHQGRDRVVRFTADLAKQDLVSLRSDCPKCHASYSVSVPRTRLAAVAKLYCPNCGEPRDRPHVPVPAVAKPGQEI